MNKAEKLKTYQMTSCPICGSNENKYAFEAVDVRFSETMLSFKIASCLGCNSKYLMEPPIKDSMGQFYPEKIYHSFTEQSRLLQRQDTIREKLKRFIRKRLKKGKATFIDRVLTGFVPSHWKAATYVARHESIMLDIGCGEGWQLDVYKDFGWKTYGIDIGQEAVKQARLKGHEVIEGDVEGVDYPHKNFELVQIKQVIEHVYDPVVVIEKAYLCLKDNGVLFLETPNDCSILAWYFKQDYWQIDAPRHLQIFSKKGLVTLLERKKFKIEQIYTRSTGRGILNSIQNRHKRLNNSGFSSWEYYGYLCLNILLRFPLIIADYIGFGENIVVFARKINKNAD